MKGELMMNINVGDSVKMNGNVGEIVKFTTDAHNDEWVCVLYNDGAYKSYEIDSFMNKIMSGVIEVETESVW